MDETIDDIVGLDTLFDEDYSSGDIDYGWGGGSDYSPTSSGGGGLGINFNSLGGTITTIGGIVSSIINSNNKVEIAKYQAEIAKSNATIEEKKAVARASQQRLATLQKEEEDKAKRSNLYLYGGIGLGILIFGFLAYIFFIKKDDTPKQVAQPTPQPINYTVPKPVTMT
jgi:hypothetical protein